MTVRPLIGITGSLSNTSHGETFVRAYVKNAQAIERAGGLPVLIPPTLGDDALRDLFERLDGVLLPGGEDVNPARYGAEPHPLTKGVLDARDQTEITLVHWATEADRPLFCICRGHQVFNVAMGGSLVQDIPDLMPAALTHWVRDPRDERPHPVDVEPASRLAAILGTHQLRNLPVNSIHHQGILAADVGRDLSISALAPDGMVEGLELPDRRFALSVQWHPEDLTADPAMQGLFDAFVQAARSGKEAAGVAAG